MTPHELALERARAALNGGDAALARRTCEELLRANGCDAAARHLRGRCMAALGMLEAAVGDFSKTLEVQPNHFAALADLGVALTALGHHGPASERLSAALARDNRPAELHFALGQCRFACGELRSAAESFAATIARQPHFADAHTNLGVALDRLDDVHTALQYFERAQALQPQAVRAHRNVANALRRAGRPMDAIVALAQAAALDPHDSELQCELAEGLFDAGRLAEALEAARGAAAIAPGCARAHAAVGMALLGAERWSDAAPHLEQALQLDPRLDYIAVNLGETLLQLQQAESAAQAFRAALAVADLPEASLGLARALLRLGNVAAATRCLLDACEAPPNDGLVAVRAASELERLGALDEAAGVLERAAIRAPRDARIQHASGAFFHRGGRYAEAVACYERALGLDAHHLRALLDRGHACESMGRLEDAARSFSAALATQPQCAEALAGLVSCAFRRCDWPQLDSCLKLLHALPEGLDALHPFLLLALDLSPAQQLRSLARRVPPAPARAASARRRAPAPLRVAYVSPDFREHAVAHALVGVIEAHDRRRVEAVGVALASADQSVVGTRLRSAFDVLIDAAALADDAVIARLRELEIDLAIDLAGFTTGARTSLFAARCAPIQVNYLGFPATTGATFMDYIIADAVVIPETEEHAYAERVLRLPHCYLPLDSTQGIATGAFDRAGAGLPEDGLVFCAFNNSYKITHEMFRVWMNLLRQVPGSVLWLRRMDAQALANLTRAAGESGVAASRLIVAPYVERREEYLALLQLADLFLDTSPYNAHTTGADALWAGVPVLSCCGQSFAGRVGASLLKSAGLPELICSSRAEYEAEALRLAGTPEELRALRARVALVRGSGAFATRTYTRSLETLYETMWRRSQG